MQRRCLHTAFPRVVGSTRFLENANGRDKTIVAAKVNVSQWESVLGVLKLLPPQGGQKMYSECPFPTGPKTQRKLFSPKVSSSSFNTLEGHKEDVSLLMGFTYHTPAIISVSDQSDITHQYYKCSHKKDSYLTFMFYLNTNLLRKPIVLSCTSQTFF